MSESGILEAIRLNENGKLELLDQLKLPEETVYLTISSVKEGWQAINQMNVRGAPAIAIAGVLSIYVEMNEKINTESVDELRKYFYDSLDFLVTARPTAVNMADAASKLKTFFESCLNETKDAKEIKERLMTKMYEMLEEDVHVNRSIGNYGAMEILDNVRRISSAKVNILTHCNTGSLATAGYGTALGIVRRLHELNRLNHCYCTETRPYNQGSRLTAYELVYEKIPATLICDSMVGILLATKSINAIVVGADRVVSNGDTANKIGTYQLAILANYHKVPFYVAVPTTSIDLTRRDGSEIEIEERPTHELTCFKGQRVAAAGIHAWNPAFDVTPADLITGLVTEFGVFKPSELESRLKSLSENNS